MKDTKSPAFGALAGNAGGKWFSVSYECKVGGSSFRPGVCYRAPAALLPSIEGMVSRGTAKLYDEEMVIVTGRPVPVKKRPPVQARAASVPYVLPSKNVKAVVSAPIPRASEPAEPKRKKKKDFD